ncbi:MAG TPA: HAD family hydrolase [Verrucomicrobiae bacterium]|jgi:phosphoglycolate phosphatase-like HAD superfamily hydrolase|nr:HAD family hydrolase [Verrucomicrobiae bacterium]
MVRLVLFDIDGTLLHTNAVGIRAFDRTLESEFNVSNGTAGLKFAGRTDTGLVRELFGRHGIEVSKKNFQRFFDNYANWLSQMLAETGGEVCPGAWDLIRELQALPNPPALGLLTGNIRLGAEIKLRYFKLWDIFVTGAFADDHEDRNQIAAIAFQRGSQFLGESLRSNQVVVIGDTPHDVACGRAIGAKVLAVATGVSPVAELQSLGPDWAVADLTKITAREIC